MNPSQISSSARLILGYVVTNLMTYMVARGIIQPADSAAMTDAVITLIVAGIGAAHVAYSAYINSKAALAAKVQASPTEKVLTTDPSVKAAVPGVELVQKV